MTLSLEQYALDGETVFTTISNLPKRLRTMAKKIDKSFSFADTDIEHAHKRFSSFEFECQVRLQLAKHKFDNPVAFEDSIEKKLRHGGTYQDPITGKLREFDIRFSLTFAKSFSVILAIECKRIGTYSPVLLTRSPRTRDETRVDSFGNRLPRQFNQIYKANEPVGKEIGQFGKAEFGDKEIVEISDGTLYDKWSQALSSANELCAEAHDNFCIGYPQLVLPILVVPENTLWTIDYTEEGILAGRPKRRDFSPFYVDWPVTHPTKGIIGKLGHLEISTLNGLTVLIQERINSIYELVS